MNINIDKDIQLSKLELKYDHEFLNSIHELKNYADPYRVHYQDKLKALGDVKNYITSKNESAAANISFFIRKSDKIQGVFDITKSKTENHLEFKFWLFKEQQKKGIMTKVLPKLIHYSAENFNKDKIICMVDLGNVPAQKLLLKSGFEASSSLYEGMSIKGKPVKEKIFFYNLN